MCCTAGLAIRNLNLNHNAHGVYSAQYLHIHKSAQFQEVNLTAIRRPSLSDKLRPGSAPVA